MSRKPLFDLGTVVITANAKEVLDPIEYFSALRRHASGDWGVMCIEDKEQNDEAVVTGEERIFSAYLTKDGRKFWIITEWDRSITTVLMPEDY